MIRLGDHPSSMGADDAAPLIWTPQAIANLIRSIDGYVEDLNTQIVKQLSNQHPTWYSDFRRFRAEWQKFKADNSGFGARLWGSTAVAAEGYKRRAEEWRAKLEGTTTPSGKPLAFSSPAKLRTGGTPPPPPPWYADLPWLKIGIGATALFALWPLITGARAGASVLGARMRTNPKKVAKACRKCEGVYTRAADGVCSWCKSDAKAVRSGTVPSWSSLSKQRK